MILTISMIMIMYKNKLIFVIKMSKDIMEYSLLNICALYMYN